VPASALEARPKPLPLTDLMAATSAKLSLPGEAARVASYDSFAVQTLVFWLRGRAGVAGVARGVLGCGRVRGWQGEPGGV
jgi:hypothetical protein